MWRLASFVMISVAAVACLAACGGQGGGDVTAVPDTAWDDMFQAYGDTSGAWSGGDGAQSLRMPDGATTWFFGDTELGPVAADGTRSPLRTGIAHNSALRYADGVLGPPDAAGPGLGGYSPLGDYTWVAPPPGYPETSYELINGDQVIDGGRVFKFYQLADRQLHPSLFPYKLVGTVVESFSLGRDDTLAPLGGTPVAVQDSADSDPVIWGAALLRAGGYLYIYGVRPYDVTSFPLYLARVPTGGLAAGAPWQYYAAAPSCGAGRVWSDSPEAAVPLRNGVSAGFSVTLVNGTYVLVTNDASPGPAANDAVAYYAACPTGFSPSGPRHVLYRPELPGGYLAYEYRVVPQFSDGSHVLISYSTDSLRVDGSCLSENYYDARVYRPRFLDVSLPGIGGPSGQVARPPDRPVPRFTRPSARSVFHPRGVWDGYASAQCQPGSAPAGVPFAELSGVGPGSVSVRWGMSPEAMWRYTMLYCDLTATIVPACASPVFVGTTSTTLRNLLSGHTYQIRVAAAKWVPGGVPAWSAPILVTIPGDR